jgi:c-di-GMP-binding flagellar brake protein YcgR
MKLTPITRDEIAVGRPIPWTLYNATGNVILKAGVTLKSAEQINSLLKIGAGRDLDEPAAAIEPDNSASRSNTLTLEQVKLNIGDSLQLQFQSESELSRCFVTLIGYLADQGVIVSTPVLNGSVMLIREGQIFVVRLFSGKSAYAFTATTLKVTNTPFPHLHLSYPKEVRGLVVRGSSRARANIICHASNAHGNGFACVARDISMGGALIAVKEKVGEVGDKLSLKLRVKISDAEHVLILDCIIRSSNNSKPSTDETPTVLHGLSFENISTQDTLVISALLYQNLVNEKDSEE